MPTFVISNFNETWNAKWNVKWYIYSIYINTHTCFQYGNGTGDWCANICKINDQYKSSQQEEIGVILPKHVEYLTHRDLVSHMWVNWVIIDLGNGLSIIWRQVISWVNEEFFNKTHSKMWFKMLSSFFIFGQINRNVECACSYMYVLSVRNKRIEIIRWYTIDMELSHGIVLK